MVAELPENKLWWAVIERAIDDIAAPRPLSVGRAELPYIRTTAYDFLYERRRDLFCYTMLAGAPMFTHLCAWLDRWRAGAIAAIEDYGAAKFATWTPWKKADAVALFRAYCPDQTMATLIPHLAQICVLEKKWPPSRSKSSS